MTAPVPIDVVARMLDQRAPSLAPELLPNGHREGNYWRVGSIEGEPGQSLAVNINGPMIGKWTDFSADTNATDRSGDMLTLVALVYFGGKLGLAFQWARSHLGLDDLSPERLARERAAASRRAQTAEQQAKRKAEWLRRKSQALVLDPRAVPVIDTPAELYLAGRGIDMSLLDRCPRALAFHPAVWCEEANADLPCMLARVIDGHGTHIGTHRTWLEPNPDGYLWRKASVPNPKKALGGFLGGYIPLWKGRIAKPLHKLPAGEPIAVSEGIEDGLTVACACPELRVVAAVSLSNIANLPVPPNGPDGRPGNPVTIIGQNDPAGSKADQALQRVVAKLLKRGIAVSVARPPAHAKDANDLAQGEAA